MKEAIRDEVLRLLILIPICFVGGIIVCFGPLFLPVLFAALVVRFVGP